MVQDTINSIRVTLNERIGNPFISATLIACVLLNWKLSLLLFSDVPYDTKVEKILSLYPDPASRVDNFLLHPLYFGLFWTFIWPVINVGINAYWHWMKSNISNAKLWAERKKKLSEAEAAELYSTIDAQESKYLEFLKDRQNKIDTLTKQIEELMRERTALQNEIEKQKLAGEVLEQKLIGLQQELSNSRDIQTRVISENEERRRALDEISSRSIDYAERLPGLPAITNAINKTTNFQANETWIWEELQRQDSSLSNEDIQKMLNFYLALGLIKRQSDNQIIFGDRLRYSKDRLVSANNNS